VCYQLALLRCCIIYMCTHTNKNAHTHTLCFTQSHTPHTRTNMRAHTHTNTYTNIHIHTHTHIHTPQFRVIQQGRHIRVHYRNHESQSSASAHNAQTGWIYMCDLPRKLRASCAFSLSAFQTAAPKILRSIQTTHRNH